MTDAPPPPEQQPPPEAQSSPEEAAPPPTEPTDSTPPSDETPAEPPESPTTPVDEAPTASQDEPPAQLDPPSDEMPASTVGPYDADEHAPEPTTPQPEEPPPATVGPDDSGTAASTSGPYDADREGTSVEPENRVDDLPAEDNEANPAHRELLNEYADRLMKEHHGKDNGNPLTDVNARKALEGPTGSTPFVGPVGSGGADVSFHDDNANLIFEREVKTTNGTESAFNNAASTARTELNGPGELFVQGPASMTSADAQGWVSRFQGRRDDANLARYDDINARFVDRDGNEIYQHRLGQRL
jgi:hypothetical protein